jgi:DHA2 family multidrug resistance protein
MPKDKVNRATGLINLARNIGGSCGIAMVTTMLERRAQYHQNVLMSHITPYDFAFRETLGGAARAAMAHGTPAALAPRQAQAMLYGLVQRESVMMAFVDNFWLLGITFLALIPLMLLVKSTSHPRRP